MPELPEVETIARELHRRLSGRIVVSAVVVRRDVLREATPGDMEHRCTGRSITGVRRRAKSVVITLAGGEHLLIQPRFTGAVLVHDAGESGDAPDPYEAVAWELADGGRFAYRDVRRLGTVTLADDAGLAAYDRRIGIEPLDPEFTPHRLSGLLRGTRSAIKKVLMDQRVLAGVGNIYANEALFAAGIDPSRTGRSLRADEIGRLHAELVDVLQRSIEARGTTFRDYRDPSNRAGGFAELLRAYGREGHPCVVCGTRLSGTHAIDGRSTVFCHRCQR